MIEEMIEMTTTREILTEDIDKKILIEMIVEKIAETTVARADMIKIAFFLHPKRSQRITTEVLKEDTTDQEMGQETGQDIDLVMKKDLLARVTAKADL